MDDFLTLSSQPKKGALIKLSDSLSGSGNVEPPTPSIGRPTLAAVLEKNEDRKVPFLTNNTLLSGVVKTESLFNINRTPTVMESDSISLQKTQN